MRFGRYLTLDDHGGGCCGIQHLSGFGEIPTGDRLSSLDDALKSYRQEAYPEVFDNDGGCDCEDCTRRKNINEDNFNILVEVVLADYQCETGWPKELKKRGFKFVNRFHNSNSGNWCNIFHYTPCEPADPNGAPFNWENDK